MKGNILNKNLKREYLENLDSFILATDSLLRRTIII